MKWARIINNVAIETTDVDPVGRFSPEIVWEKVSTDITPNSTRNGSVWTIAPVPEPVQTERAPDISDIKISPIEFKLLWTAQERVSIKSLRESDPITDDFFDIIDDVRLTYVNLSLQSTQQAVDYLLTKLVAATVIQSADVPVRRAAILSGQFL
jgi:hypothetical protein